jgi:predicted nucleic acid-binding protein
MNASAADCVMDASVGIKLYLEETLTDQAHALLARLSSHPPAQFFVPDLFYIECTNILWKYVTRFGMTQDDATYYIARLGDLALHSTPTADLMADALTIALAYKITAYDAAYVALAKVLQLPLITADRKLVQALAGTGHRVLWLGDYPFPSTPVR